MNIFMVVVSLVFGLNFGAIAPAHVAHVGGGVVDAGQRCAPGEVVTVERAQPGVVHDGSMIIPTLDPVYGCMPSRTPSAF